MEPLDAIRDALNAPALLEVRRYHMDRLEALFAGETAGEPFYLWGTPASCTRSIYAEPDAWLDGSLAMLAASDQRARAMDRRVFRPQVIESYHYGVRLVDRVFQARVYEAAQSWWGDGLAQPVGLMKAPDLDRNETWTELMAFALRFRAYGVAAPLFGLPTIASTLNIAYNLLGESLLLAMLDDPEAVRHDFAVITGTLCRMHAWYRATIPSDQLQPVVAAFRTQPPGFGQVCGCATHLLSAGLYRAYGAPADSAVLSAHPRGGMMHLCGAHTQHLSTFRDMTALRAVQLNDRASEDFETYYHELRDDQVIYLNPTPTMTARKALRYSGGRRLVIVQEPQT